MSKRWRVEEKLPKFFALLDERVTRDEDRRAAEEERERTRRRQWEEALENAKRSLLEEQRAAQLRLSSLICRDGARTARTAEQTAAAYGCRSPRIPASEAIEMIRCNHSIGSA